MFIVGWEVILNKIYSNVGDLVRVESDGSCRVEVVRSIM